jgi:hypothetical protein
MTYIFPLFKIKLFNKKLMSDCYLLFDIFDFLTLDAVNLPKRV